MWEEKRPEFAKLTALMHFYLIDRVLVEQILPGLSGPELGPPCRQL